ncbi:hypothetical protein [Spiroplasma diminutum]|uniref:Uncharacterized protein n=1 Tax=Spiroplasma diminutum CUAS-1 TaxID=1276221 RepID=S5MEA3_9MOLU|nr:hypothetical protein [Spiroplasma diminutum]AGR42058.1 hypothetical protein SDIMI_v3c03540 [Spiroplasma diminutum CUAS-1]
MANKKKVSKSDIDNSVTLAMEELLSLSSVKFEDEKKVNKVNKVKEKNSKKIKEEKIEVKLDEPEENFDPTNLASIIKHAKKVGSQLQGKTWVDPDEQMENDIISKAKSQGKSAYDSDVLRELILQRQKKKRESTGLSSIINKTKNK